jgi:hypothetical protein
MMLTFFPNSLDPLSRVAANLVDEYPLGSYDYLPGRCTQGIVYYLAFEPGFQFNQWHKHK